MITVEESIYLLSSDLTSEFYLPQDYLCIPQIQDGLHNYNWMIIPSLSPGWVLLRRRIVYQD